MQRPMSMNGYSWVEGNVINAVDPSGEECLNDFPTGCEIYLIGGNWESYRQCRDEYSHYPPIFFGRCQYTEYAQDCHSCCDLLPLPRVAEREECFQICEGLPNKPNLRSEDSQVLLLGGRIDFSGSIAGQFNFDVNIELQIVPWHLQPRYIGRRDAFDVVINTGPEFNSSPGGGGTIGLIVGSVSSRGYGSASPAYTYGGSGQILGGTFEADVTSYTGNSDAVLYIGVGTRASLPGVSVYGGTSESESLPDLIISAGEAIMRILR